MGHHFATDFAEAAKPVRNREEAVIVQRRYIAGYVPTLAEGLGRFLRRGQIALHQVRPPYEEHSGLILVDRLECFRIDNAYTDSRKRVAYCSAS